jgi:osomolarity two-component system sensor histidine kinase NIK1
MGINTYYTTPLNLQELSNAIVPALESHQVPQGDAVKDTVLSILLAEDNLVNQKLAVKLLEVAGHKIEVADNGEIAIEKYKRRQLARTPFDVILVSRGGLSEWQDVAHVADGRVDAGHGWHGSDFVDTRI